MTQRSRKPYNPDDIVLARLDETDLSNLANFNCRDDEVNHFLREEAYQEQGLGLNYTTLLYYQGRLAAFCSVCCDAIPFNPEEKEQYDLPYASAPAIKLARLGRTTEFRDYGFGEYLVEYVKNEAYKLYINSVGVRFITVDAYPEKVEYYRGQGFTENQRVNKNRRQGQPVSMRADIFD